MTFFNVGARSAGSALNHIKERSGGLMMRRSKVKKILRRPELWEIFEHCRRVRHSLGRVILPHWP